MNLSYRDNMGVVLLVEIIEIRLMLEIVCLNLSLVCGKVRLYIVVVGHDLNVHAFFL